METKIIPIISKKVMGKAEKDGGAGTKEILEMVLPKLEKLQGDSLQLRVKYNKNFSPSNNNWDDKASLTVKARKKPRSKVGAIFAALLPWKTTKIKMPFYVKSSNYCMLLGNTKEKNIKEMQKIADKIEIQTSDFLTRKHLINPLGIVLMLLKP